MKPPPFPPPRTPRFSFLHFFLFRTECAVEWTSGGEFQFLRVPTWPCVGPQSLLQFLFSRWPVWPQFFSALPWVLSRIPSYSLAGLVTIITGSQWWCFSNRLHGLYFPLSLLHFKDQIQFVLPPISFSMLTLSPIQRTKEIVYRFGCGASLLLW